MFEGIKARLREHRERMLSRRARERHAKAKKPTIGLAGITRRAMFTGGAIAMITAQCGPVDAAWWFRSTPPVPGFGLDILAYQPGVHYSVGRTSLNIPRKAVNESNRIVGFASDQYTVPPKGSQSGAPPAGFKVNFTVNNAAYPWDMYVGAMVTVASEATMFSGNIVYVNGKVTAWNFATKALEITVPKSGNGYGVIGTTIGAAGGAGGLRLFLKTGDPLLSNQMPSFNTDGNQHTDWTLTLHTPPCHYPDSNGNFTRTTDPMLGDFPLTSRGFECQDWDFSDFPGSLRGSNLVNGNSLLWSNCTFEQANRMIADTGQGAFLAMAGTNGRFINCDFPWSWRKWAITATVTSDVTSGQTTVTIPVSGSLLENPLFLLPLQRSSVGTIKAKTQGGQAYRYRVANLTNPGTVQTCYVSDCVDNTSVTLTGLQDNGQGILPPIVGGQTVKTNDVLIFFPDPSLSNFVSGNVGLISDCNIDNLQDLYNPGNIITRTPDGNGGLLPASNVFTRSIINNIGAVNGHDDISQIYAWQGVMEMSFLKINHGWKPGDERWAAALRCNNPREMCIWVNNLGWNGETRVHDIMMVTIQGWQLGSVERVSNSFVLPIKGAVPFTDAQGNNFVRLSFSGPFNGGTVTAGQELWTLRGTGTSLDANFMAANATPLTLGGGSGILNGSVYARFSVQAASQGDTTLTATSTMTVATAPSTALLGRGTVLVIAGTASAPNQVIGYIDSMSTPTVASGTVITLGNPGGLGAALAAGASVYALPWVDMATPIPVVVPKLGGNFKATAKVGDYQIDVGDTTLFSKGMAIQGYLPGNLNQQADAFVSPAFPDDTYVASIDNATKLTLTRPVSNAFTNKWLTIAPALRGNKTGASYFYNIFVGNKDTGLATSTDFAYRTGQGYEVFYNSVFGGVAAWNIFDLNRQPLQFYINDPAYTDGGTYYGQLGPVYNAAQITAYNKPLTTPPNNLKVTPLGGGQIRIEFDPVPGAKAYTYTLNGGQNFQLDPKNNQAASNGTIISGTVISGLSGTLNVGVASLIGANDIGVPVIRGAISSLRTVSVAA